MKHKIEKYTPNIYIRETHCIFTIAKHNRLQDAMQMKYRPVVSAKIAIKTKRHPAPALFPSTKVSFRTALSFLKFSSVSILQANFLQFRDTLAAALESPRYNTSRAKRSAGSYLFQWRSLYDPSQRAHSQKATLTDIPYLPRTARSAAAARAVVAAADRRAAVAAAE